MPVRQHQPIEEVELLLTQPAISEVLGERHAALVAACVGAVVVLVWWVVPFVLRNRRPPPLRS